MHTKKTLGTKITYEQNLWTKNAIKPKIYHKEESLIIDQSKPQESCHYHFFHFAVSKDCSLFL